MVKRLRVSICICILYAFLLPVQAQLYVAPNGSDANDGTINAPFATLQKALRTTRDFRRLHDDRIQNGMFIKMFGGLYSLTEPVRLRPGDAGTATSPTIIESAENQPAILSGGVIIKGWKKLQKTPAGLPAAAKGNIWVTDVPLEGGRPFEFRQLWINDKKAIRARDRNGDSMNRILSWNKTEETCWIPTPETPSLSAVLTAEMFIHQWWAVATLRIRHFEVHGDSTKLFFHQPESRIQSEHPWPAPWISKETGNSAFYLTNAIEFLDEPGEWYLDITAQKLYYWPRQNENLSTANVVAPYLETLVKLEGTIDNRVQYITFKNISFQHSSWLRPSQQGHVPHQAGMYMWDAYKLKIPGTADKKGLENQAWVGRPSAAVVATYTNNTAFQNCRFEHLASTGLDYEKGNTGDTISENLFKDIGGTALLLGTFSDEQTEVHLPYQPKDERELTDNLLVTNNVIHDVTNEDWGCVGIGAGYVKNTRIEHNEISGVNYTGISLGWGWTKTINAMRNNVVFANKIHHYGKQMYDVAAIYTLSAQPGTVISQNYIDSIYKAPYAHIPYHWFYLYTDEGSSYMTIKDNWCPAEKFLQNANGPNNTWENNGPMVADSIKLAAGPNTAFAKNLAKKAMVFSTWPINIEQPVIVEIISKTLPDLIALKKMLVQQKVDSSAIYQWDNHTIIFDKVPDLFTLKMKLAQSFPAADIKVYDDLFYNFNQSLCENKTPAKKWSHTILTANLVADTKLQKEYLDHHATQFQKWPDVSRGFCNAGFQQLLLFKNGRQLMLVISIPQGENLDHINPKTTANNPKMDEWNAIMKKYQEGITGTKPGETWVQLKQID